MTNAFHDVRVVSSVSLMLYFLVEVRVGVGVGLGDKPPNGGERSSPFTSSGVALITLFARVFLDLLRFLLARYTISDYIEIAKSLLNIIRDQGPVST